MTAALVLLTALIAPPGPLGTARAVGLPSMAPPPIGTVDLVVDVGFAQKLGAQLPTDVKFTDDKGRTVTLGDVSGGRPSLFLFVYYGCPMLCGLVLQGLVGALKAVKLTPGEDFDIVALSIDPRETPEDAAAKKASLVEGYGRPETADGWHLLTGDQESIRAVADAVGFRYAWDEERKQFAHAAGVMVLTSGAKLSKLFYGVEYSPRDLRLGLVDAGGGRIGTFVDAILLYCYHYDPATGRYGPVIMGTMRLAGLGTVLLLFGFIGFWLYRERRGRGAAPPSAEIARG